jgi:hypothetical protein
VLLGCKSGWFDALLESDSTRFFVFLRDRMCLLVDWSLEFRQSTRFGHFINRNLSLICIIIFSGHLHLTSILIILHHLVEFFKIFCRVIVDNIYRVIGLLERLICTAMSIRELIEQIGVLLLLMRP